MGGLYQRLGVRTVVNGEGTVTALGGSLMHPEVLEAMREASTAFVDMRELHHRAGLAIAELLDVPAVCITSGAAAGLTVASAAFIAGDRADGVLALPDTREMRDEAVVLKAHRILYDQAIRTSGARFVEVGVTSAATLAEVEAAFSERTGFLFFAAEAATMRGSLPFADMADLAHRHRIPVLVDAAAELPPVNNVTRFLDEGADLVVFSGGKEIRGPQSSGFIVGSETYVRRCEMHAFPNHAIGRAMKMDKETIAGLVRAVELWVERDYDGIQAEWSAMVDDLLAALDGLPGVVAERGYPTEPGIQPTVIPRAYIRHAEVSANELRNRLLARSCPVALGVEGGRLAVNPQCLTPDDLDVVRAALTDELTRT